MPGQSTTLALAGLLCLAAPGLQPDAPLVVSAAISLTDAFRALEKAYRAGGGGPLRFNFAASNVLARQIANGAPVDVFVSADVAQMQYAERAGAILPGSSRALLSNRLAVVTPPGRRLHRSDAGALAGSSISRIAIGDPAAVPAGFYARQYLERAGLWQRVEPKLLPLPNVRAALAAVASGGADAGIGCEANAPAPDKVTLAFVVPATEAPEIVYPAAIVARTKHRAAAEKFLAFLASSEAHEIFRRFKFRPYVAPPGAKSGLPDLRVPASRALFHERPGSASGRRARAPRTPHPAPRTPHAAPRTPHPAPRTPHPAPRTPHPASRP